MKKRKSKSKTRNQANKNLPKKKAKDPKQKRNQPKENCDRAEDQKALKQDLVHAATPLNPDALVEVRDLSVDFRSSKRTTHAVKHISFDIHPGETVGWWEKVARAKPSRLFPSCACFPTPPLRTLAAKFISKAKIF